jgi:membrane-bound serine protease (ClpP class)
MDSRQLYRKPPWLSLLFPCAIVFVAVLLSLSLSTRSAEAASPHVDVMVLNSDISPASLRFLTRAIDTAEHDGAQALVVEIDTPGGDIDSMKAMTQAELASSVPIIAYVSPTGGRAASAGAFVTLAAHIAAMAPTTRIGASSPVTSTGGDIENTLKSKIENDLIASITGMQERYRRDVPSAVAMVTDAKSYDDNTAIQKHLVDLGAANLNDLLSKAQGKMVTLNSGRSVTLQTANVSMQMINASTIDTLYTFLLDPNVVFLLFIVAMIGTYLEISHPGVILPGVAGAIALLLFLFAAGSLSPNWAGLGLMVLAFVFLILDVQLPTHGVLTIGAVISLTVGALLFFNSGGPYDGPQVNPLVVYTMSGVIGLIGLTLVTFIVRARRKAAPSGVATMIGAKAIALTALLPEGRVNYAGENWAAILVPPTTSVDAGSEVQIVAVEGLRLFVQPIRPLVHNDIYSISTSE